MIRLTDTATLAFAKLRTKRLLMLFSVLASGLLFSLTIASLIVISGIQESFNNFNQQSGGNSFLVYANPIIPSSVTRVSNGNTYFMGDADSKRAHDEIVEQFNQYVDEQRQEAKELGIDFNADSITPPFLLWKNSGARSNTYILNETSPFYQHLRQIRQKNFATTATNSISNLTEIAKKFNATAVYDAQKSVLSYQNANLVTNEVENYLELGQLKEFSGSSGINGETDTRNAIISISNEPAIINYLSLTNDDQRRLDDHIPIMITPNEAQAMFGKKHDIDIMPNDGQDKVDWMVSLRNQISGETFEICHRNSAEMARINEFIRQNSVIERKDADGNIIIDNSEPTIIYKQPAKACQLLEITEDRRSEQAKRSDENLIAFQKRKGTHVEPQVTRLKFQVVGILPIVSDNVTKSSTSQNLQELAQSLFTTNYNGAIIPYDLYQQSEAQKIYGKLIDELSGSNSILNQAGVKSGIIEFSSVSDTKAFLAQDCPGDEYDKNRQACDFGFDLYPTGKNYLLYDTIQHNLSNVIKIAFAIIAVISGLILCLTMARVIVDSRRETAIFRALGAKRSDIIRVYGVYSLLIAGRVIFTAIIFTTIIVTIWQLMFSSSLTTLAKLSWNVFAQDLRFNLFGFNLQWLALVLIAIVLITLTAILPPLIRNVRRNPINDMRDE